MLTLAAAAWGLSFPGGKALLLALGEALPGRSEWFFSALMISARFTCAALLLLAWRPRAMARLRASEVRQGLGLGVFSGLGMLLQSDGLHYTTASAVAFLTQFTAALVPLALAVWHRRWPTGRTILCVLMVLAGCAILGQFDWRALRFGRGEAETLLATVFFAAQILWLDRPVFRGNDTGRVSMVMFAAIGAVTAPVWLSQMQGPADLAVLVATPGIAVNFLALTLVCSIFAFLLMNHFQPHIDPTTAGIVYCSEPLFATALALFLPAWLGAWMGVAYANEVFTFHLVAGGALITAANVLIALQPPARS
jgi:drug/metabolite transporter (DMT)-like permease